MRFVNHWLFLLGLVIPLIIYAYFRKKRIGQIRFSSLLVLQQISASKKPYLRHLLLVLRLLCLLLLLAVIARPQSGHKSTEIITEGVDIMLALDTSGSMQAMDFKIGGERANRLEVVKKVVADFIKRRQNDRLGMVVFGEEAFTQCPLTLDQGVLLSFLDKVEIGMAGDSTAIGSAIGVAVKRLKDLNAKSRIIILLTDGQSNAGRLSPEQATELAQKYNIKIYTIGAGTRGEAPFLVKTLFGEQVIYQQVDIDEDTLQKVAIMTSAQYFRATDTESLEKIYALIDKMEKSQVKVKEHMEYNELFHWPLLAALVVLLIEVLLGSTFLRKIP
ncbi:MAG: VWA domain-containing protein [Candidatus Schekmanbacteria bacterium]|nr:VWA domain-containing protein [Candidatus Schekmanbacteria bacterium]